MPKTPKFSRVGLMQLRSKQQEKTSTTSAGSQKSAVNEVNNKVINNNNNSTASSPALIKINLKDRANVRRVTANVSSVIECNTPFHHNLRTRGRSKGLSRLRMLNNNMSDATNTIETIDNTESFINDKLNANVRSVTDDNVPSRLKSSPSSGSSGIASLSKDDSDDNDEVTVRSTTSTNIKRTKRSLSSSRVEKDRVDEKGIKVLRKNCALQQPSTPLSQSQQHHSSRHVSRLRTPITTSSASSSCGNKSSIDSRIVSNAGSNSSHTISSNTKKSTNDASNSSCSSSNNIKSESIISSVKVRKR